MNRLRVRQGGTVARPVCWLIAPAARTAKGCLGSRWSRLQIAFWALLAWLLSAGAAFAHNQSYAMLRAQISADGAYRVEMNFHVAALLLGEEQGHLNDDARARWVKISDQELSSLTQRAADYLKGAIEIYGDDRLSSPDKVAFPDLATLRADGLVDIENARPSAPVIVTGRLPEGARTFAIAAPVDFAESLVSIRTDRGSAGAQALRTGQRSEPFPLDSTPADAASTALPVALVTIWQYVRLGFEHILPMGIDHVLFVLALFFLTPRRGALGWQVTAFTLAHSVTLALAVFGLVQIPAVIVEPLIAASIAALAIDNLFTDRLRRWRTGAVFGFGLLHGLGFAGALREIGLPPGDEAAALISFNLGVELGQITVLALAFAAFGWFRDRDWFRPNIALPISAAIAGFGVYWTVERILANL